MSRSYELYSIGDRLFVRDGDVFRVLPSEPAEALRCLGHEPIGALAAVAATEGDANAVVRVEGDKCTPLAPTNHHGLRLLDPVGPTEVGDALTRALAVSRHAHRVLHSPLPDIASMQLDGPVTRELRRLGVLLVEAHSQRVLALSDGRFALEGPFLQLHSCVWPSGLFTTGLGEMRWALHPATDAPAPLLELGTTSSHFCYAVSLEDPTPADPRVLTADEGDWRRALDAGGPPLSRFLAGVEPLTLSDEEVGRRVQHALQDWCDDDFHQASSLYEVFQTLELLEDEPESVQLLVDALGDHPARDPFVAFLHRTFGDVRPADAHREIRIGELVFVGWPRLAESIDAVQRWLERAR